MVRNPVPRCSTSGSPAAPVGDAGVEQEHRRARRPRRSRRCGRLRSRRRASPHRGAATGSRASPRCSDRGAPPVPPTLPDLTRRRVGVDSTSIRHRRGEEREGGSVSHPASAHSGGEPAAELAGPPLAGLRPPSRLPPGSSNSAMLAPGHDDLPPPRQRPPSHPADSLGRACIYDLRRISGLNIRARVERQTERDALVHRLRVHRRPPGAGHRGATRDRRGPRRAPGAAVPTGAVGQGSPAPGCRPLPAAPGHRRVAEPSVGETCGSRASRSCAATARSRSPDLHALLHRYGYLIGAARPVTALSDAMAYEVEHGRARRIDRGIYAATDRPPPRSAHPSHRSTTGPGPGRWMGPPRSTRTSTRTLASWAPPEPADSVRSRARH